MESSRNAIKIEKDSPSGRLQSLKIRGDLSLGIAKPKKQYAPNLNVVRNKDKTKEILKKNDQKRKEKRSNQVDRNDNNRSRFVQSTSVFSQGSGETPRRVSFERRSDSTRESGGVVPKPTIKKESTWNVNKNDEDSLYNELLNGNGDNSSDEDDLKHTFLPLKLSNNCKNPKTAIKKEEIESSTDSVISQAFNSECSEDSPSLSLVKLPDSFAGKGLSDDPNVKKLFDYPLKCMLEGQVGKLLIKKSGKMQVQIGNVKYELRAENTFESIEQLVVISENNEIAALGNVLNNFVMFPNYDSILK